MASSRPAASAELTTDLLYQILSAELASQYGQLQEATDRYIVAAKESKDAKIAKRATHFALYTKDQTKALEMARLWTASDPDNHEAQGASASLLIAKGDLDGARPHLSWLLDNAKGDEHYRVSLVTGLLGPSRKPQQSIQLLRELLDGRVSTADSLVARAQLAAHYGQTNTAMGYLDLALRDHGHHKIGMALYSQLLLNSERFSEALKMLDKAVDSFPQDNNLRLSLARLLVKMEKFPEARQQLNRLLENQPDDADILYSSGLVALELKEYDEAHQLFTRLIEHPQRNGDAHASLAEIAMVRNQIDDAISHLESINDVERYIGARLRATFIIEQHRGIDAAVKYLGKIRIHDESQEVQILLAKTELLQKAKRLDESMVIYNDALSRYPDNVDLLYARAMLLVDQNHLEQMESDLKRVLEIEPENTQALNALGYTLADRTTRYEEAFAYITRALEKLPHDPSVIDSMGWVLYRLGDVEKSLQYLRQAASLNQDGEIAAHLGEVLWQSGDQEEAQRVWSEALRHDPDHQVLQQTIGRYRQ